MLHSFNSLSFGEIIEKLHVLVLSSSSSFKVHVFVCFQSTHLMRQWELRPLAAWASGSRAAAQDFGLPPGHTQKYSLVISKFPLDYTFLNYCCESELQHDIMCSILFVLQKFYIMTNQSYTCPTNLGFLSFVGAITVEYTSHNVQTQWINLINLRVNCSLLSEHGICLLLEEDFRQARQICASSIIELWIMLTFVTFVLCWYYCMLIHVHMLVDSARRTSQVWMNMRIGWWLVN